MDLAKTLSNNYIFRGVPLHAVAGLAASAGIRRYLGGDLLVRQFEQSSDLLIILEGAARIRSFSGETVAEFGPGSMIGEMALIDNEPRSATVVAVGETKVAVLNAEMIRGLMESDPEVSSIVMTNLSKVLCRRLRSMNAREDERNAQMLRPQRKKTFGIFKLPVAS